MKFSLFVKVLVLSGISFFGSNHKVFAEDEKVKVAPKQKIVINQIVEHPALNQVRDALLKHLKEQGYGSTKPLKIIYKNALGRIETVAQISAQFAQELPVPDVFVAIGTPTAQSALAATRRTKIPIVFAAVTDPKASRLVKNLENPEQAITGVMDFPPLEDLIELMRRFVPEIKKIGTIYHSGEENSVATIKRFKPVLKAHNIDLVEAQVNTPSDISLAFKTLQSRGVDAIYIPQDNMVIAAMAQVTALSLESNLPVFTSDSGSVEEGALATVSYAYSEIGKKAAAYVIKLLEGADISTLKIGPPANSAIYVNKSTLEKMGFDLKVVEGLNAEFIENSPQ